MLVLTMNLDQEVSKLFEKAHGGRGVVDEDAVPPRPCKLTLDDELSLWGGVSRLLEGHRQRTAGRHFEDGFYGRELGAGPDEIGLRPSTAHEQEGIDDDGLAGAGLTREHVEAGRERDTRFLDDREVPDRELAQHSGTMLSPGPPCIQTVSCGGRRPAVVSGLRETEPSARPT